MNKKIICICCNKKKNGFYKIIFKCSDGDKIYCCCINKKCRKYLFTFWSIRAEREGNEKMHDKIYNELYVK